MAKTLDPVAITRHTMSRVRTPSRRRQAIQPAEFNACYTPVSAPFEAEPGTVDHWLTERYCLYTTSSEGHLYRCEVHHLPWPLQRAEADIDINTVCEANNGIELHGSPARLHFAQRLDVVLWPAEPID